MNNCFKQSFIKSYKKSTFFKKILNIFRMINSIIPKNSKLMIAYVDYEKIDGKLVPYKNDNVYLLATFIQKKRDDIKIYFTPSSQFGSKLNRGNIMAKLKLILKLLRAKIILTKMPLHAPSYIFTKSQHQIALGYFIPFKSDYFELKEWKVFYAHIMKEDRDYRSCERYKQMVLEHFVYSSNQFQNTNLTYITPSRYTSDVISRSHNIPREYFKELGSPKSDYMNNKKLDIQEIFHLKRKPSKVIIYTPTFRDNIMRKSLDELSDEEKTIFGYKNEVEELEPLLVRNNIVVIVKLHKSFPLYRELEEFYKKGDKSYFKNCYFLDFEIEAKYDISIYDLFISSDAMIADYSSISFDYLPYDRPIIYNVPDIEEYRRYRGFSYEPIEDLMAGDIAKNIEELKKAIVDVSNDSDKFTEKRKKVLSFANEISKSKSLPNIYDYLEGIGKW